MFATKWTYENTMLFCVRFIHSLYYNNGFFCLRYEFYCVFIFGWCNIIKLNALRSFNSLRLSICKELENIYFFLSSLQRHKIFYSPIAQSQYLSSASAGMTMKIKNVAEIAFLIDPKINTHGLSNGLFGFSFCLFPVLIGFVCV